MNLNDYRRRTIITFYDMENKKAPTFALEVHDWINSMQLWLALSTINTLGSVRPELLDYHIQHQSLLDKNVLPSCRDCRQLTNEELDVIITHIAKASSNELK